MVLRDKLETRLSLLVEEWEFGWTQTEHPHLSVGELVLVMQRYMSQCLPLVEAVELVTQREAMEKLLSEEKGVVLYSREEAELIRKLLYQHLQEER